MTSLFASRVWVAGVIVAETDTVLILGASSDVKSQIFSAVWPGTPFSGEGYKLIDNLYSLVEFPQTSNDVGAF